MYFGVNARNLKILYLSSLLSGQDVYKRKCLKILKKKLNRFVISEVSE